MIRYKKLIFNGFQVNTWLIYIDEGPCIIVDPACAEESERQLLLDFISTNKLKPEKILATHGHFDHLPGVSFVKEKFDIPFCGHREDLSLLQFARHQAEHYGFNFGVDPPEFNSFLVDEEVAFWGGGSFKVLHVPGHSKGSLAFHFDESGFVITGDVLFKQSIGRTDLPGGDHSTLIRSIKSKLMVMDDKTLVFSGHGPDTTIGEERILNPFLNS